MIQRIQSLYLSLTILLPLLFLKGNFLNFINSKGSEIIMNFIGTWQLTGERKSELLRNNIPLSVIIVLIPLISIISLLAFRNRKLQMKITTALILAAIIFIVMIIYYSVDVINTYQVEIEFGIKMFIPLLILILGVFALKGIKKDENLVKSYDRLR